MIKLELDELKKAIALIEAESKDLYVQVDVAGKVLSMRAVDRSDRIILVEVFADNIMLPKVTRTEVLR